MAQQSWTPAKIEGKFNSSRIVPFPTGQINGLAGDMVDGNARALNYSASRDSLRSRIHTNRVELFWGEK
jgi:hypothetical protein